METSTASAQARGQFLNDHHRPGYHFLPPANWMNDPNGLIHWQGQYHLFYQYNPSGPIHGNIHWGHAVSDDLVHWTDLPVALVPTPGSVDADGCWSGCIVDDGGVPTGVYTGLRDGVQRTCLAIGKPDLISWQKYEGNPVIAAPPSGLDLIGFRDPCVWRDRGVWYQIIGAGIAGQGGILFLYRSDDLRKWTYMHPLLSHEDTQNFAVPLGDMWECPGLFALGDRHALIVSIVADRILSHTAYFVGMFQDHRFIPESSARLDWSYRSYYAPQILQDDQGRHLILGWIQEGRTKEAQLTAGWSGVMSLPRLISTGQKGSLAFYFAPELKVLRRRHIHFSDLEITSSTLTELNQIRGDMLEIKVEFERCAASHAGLKIRRSPDGREETQIYIDWSKNQLVLNRERSSLDPTAEKRSEKADLLHLAGDRVKLHLYLDRSVVEMIAADQIAITGRIYPTRTDSVELALFAEGGTARVKSLDIWQLGSTW